MYLLVVYAFYMSKCSSLVLVTRRVLYHHVYQPTACLSYSIVIKVTAHFWNRPSMLRGCSSSAPIKQLDSSKAALLLYWLRRSSHPFPQSLVLTWGRLFTILIDLGAMSYSAVNTLWVVKICWKCLLYVTKIFLRKALSRVSRWASFWDSRLRF